MKPTRQDRGRRARQEGRRAEWIAAGWLLLRGWRIVAFRYRTRLGEIDIVARRDDVLAIIEVKRRRTVAEALEAVKPQQRRRLLAAGQQLAGQHPAWRQLSLRLDLIALAPGRLPRHIENAWPDQGA